MLSMFYLLSLCVVTVIQLTSSQSTWDSDRQENDVSSCASTLRTELMFSQLMNAVSQLQKDVAKLQSGCRQEKRKLNRI